jgi:HEAT repeat protein
LIKQLRTGDFAARLAAAAELKQLRDRQATSALAAALRDQSVEVAREAAEALGALKDRSALEALKAAVLNADGYFDSSVRAAAADSLAQLQDRRAVDVLIAGVRDPIAEASRAAICALGQLGDERAIDSLAAVVRNSDNYFLSSTRSAAVEALGRFEVPAARESLRSIASDPFLDASIRQAASTALALANSGN